MIKYLSNFCPSFKGNVMNSKIYIRGGFIYIDCVVDKKRHRKSTGLKASQTNIKFTRQNLKNILQDMFKPKNSLQEMPISFSKFALLVLQSSSGSREIEYQKELESKLKRKIVPYFEHIGWEAIKPIHIENWRNELLKIYSVSTVKKYNNILKNIFKKALANELISKNPYQSIDPLRQKKARKREIYTSDEMGQILTKANGWFRHFLVVAFGTGIRTGELLALKWEDVNFEEATLTIQRSITHSRIKCTKTNEIRIIELLETVKQSLTWLYENRKSNEWIFPSKYGKPYTESKNILKYYFKPLLAELNIKYKTLYSARHTFISFMLNKGMDLLWVQHTAGHQHSTTTLQYYAFFEQTPERIKKANKIFNLAQKDALRIL